MTTESMAQTIYDVAGTALFLDTEADVPGDPDDFVVLTQGTDLEFDVVQIEGFARALRHGTSAFVHVYGKLLPDSAGVNGEPIILDLGPLIDNAQGWSGGIPGFIGLTLGGAGASVNGVTLVGAAWVLVGNGGRTLKLVDKDGVAITTGLLPGDRLGFQLSFVTVAD